jgi:hypothetical protein
MLPFHKRSRVNSSIEIGADELEAIELPPVRPPSVRPSGFPAVKRAYVTVDDDEMTIVRSDKRISSAPPPRVAVRMPVIPKAPARPRFDEDEPTQLAPGSSSRPLLSMSASARRILLDDAPPPPLGAAGLFARGRPLGVRCAP